MYHVWLPDSLQQVCGVLAFHSAAYHGQTFWDYSSVGTGLEARTENLSAACRRPPQPMDYFPSWVFTPCWLLPEPDSGPLQELCSVPGGLHPQLLTTLVTRVTVSLPEQEI